MKNKILTAINEAIYNVLSTDIDDQDINFSNTDIDNNYEQTVSLKDLNDMLKYENPNKLIKMHYDTKNAISLILDDDTEISLYEYFDPNRTQQPVFLKIISDGLKKYGNDIIIKLSNNHHISYGCKWSTQFVHVSEKPYKNAYDKFLDICKEWKKDSSYMLDAVNWCKKADTENYKAYLPNIHQLRIIAEYIDLINYILKNIGSEPIDLSGHGWWTSEEASKFDAYTLHITYADNTNIKLFKKDVKNYNGGILPLFKKIY